MYYLIGEKLSHSFSPMIHSMIADYSYELKEIEKENLEKFILKKQYRGLNVTIPYKKEVMKYLDKIDESAKKIGCVNTIVNRNGCLTGYNTDYYGMKVMLEYAGIRIKGKNILILGDGATSNTAYAVLKDMKAKKIVKASRKGRIKFDQFEKFSNTNVIINCTPVGMYPKNGKSLVKLGGFKELEAVSDCIYNPRYTKLLLDAMQKNLKITDAMVMLVMQAIKASELFTGKKYSEDVLKTTVNKINRQNSNIVFIGMPGCGKTTIAKKIAKITGKQFVDIDKEIEKRQKKKIPDIFEQKGEKYFRYIENRVIKDISKHHGLVISSGGGSILRKDNYYFLKQNSVVFYIKRNLKRLSTKGRPLSSGGFDKVLSLYKRRKNLYERYADIIVRNTTMKLTIQNIVEEYDEFFGDKRTKYKHDRDKRKKHLR